jgi:hypothetical protein
MFGLENAEVACVEATLDIQASKCKSKHVQLLVLNTYPSLACFLLDVINGNSRKFEHPQQCVRQSPEDAHPAIIGEGINFVQLRNIHTKLAFGAQKSSIKQAGIVDFQQTAYLLLLQLKKKTRLHCKV